MNALGAYTQRYRRLTLTLILSRKTKTYLCEHAFAIIAPCRSILLFNSRTRHFDIFQSIKNGLRTQLKILKLHPICVCSRVKKIIFNYKILDK